MNIKQSAGDFLRIVFPKQMEKRKQRKKLQRLKQRHEQNLKEIQERVYYTQDQWVEYIKRTYQEITGVELNLDNPRRYTEKMQWLKLYDHNPLYSVLADKYAVREWVKEKIGEEYLIPLLGVWDRVEDIDFNSLPDQFVLKTNHAFGTNILVPNKKELNYDIAKENLNYWLKYPYWAFEGEMHYKAIKPKIIAEKFMKIKGKDDLPDYKFFCFDGKVFCSYLIVDRFSNERLGIFDRGFKLLPYYRKDVLPLTESQPVPENYERMVAIAETLSKGFAQVRVDLYDICGKVYFGEMTFTTGAGFFSHEPDKFDLILGDQWRLQK